MNEDDRVARWWDRAVWLLAGAVVGFILAALVR